MNDKDIRLSPKHGLNPSVTHCFFCGEAFGVALFGQIKRKTDKRSYIDGEKIIDHDAEAPRSCILDLTPCPRCEEVMEKGVFLIGIDPEKSTTDKIDGFYRTGRVVALKDEAVERIFADHPRLSEVLKNRWIFVDDAVLEKLLPLEGEET